MATHVWNPRGCPQGLPIHLMSSRCFSGHRLWRLMCGTREDAPTDYQYIFHLMSSCCFSGHRLWPLMCGTREDAPTDYHYIHMFKGFQTEMHVKPRASHKQNYIRFPTRRITTRLSTSRLTTMEPTYPTSRITTRELASWLTGWLGGLQPGNLSCAWLAG